MQSRNEVTHSLCSQVMVPITINMVLIVFYLMMGAIIFSNWEGWDIGSACYFSFVTLSTIGFGDMVPGNRSVPATWCLETGLFRRHGARKQVSSGDIVPANRPFEATSCPETGQFR